MSEAHSAVAAVATSVDPEPAVSQEAPGSRPAWVGALADAL